MAVNRYDEYVKSRSWVCKDSPTGAHHWLINGHCGCCKYCGEEREFVISLPQYQTVDEAMERSYTIHQAKKEHFKEKEHEDN